MARREKSLWRRKTDEYNRARKALNAAREKWRRMNVNIDSLSKEGVTELQQFEKRVREAEKFVNENAMFGYYPVEDTWVWKEEFNDQINYKRDNYRKHMECIRATKEYSQVAFFAGNRIGKTLLGSYITACHLTGIYPDWWDGHRFNRPIDAWVLVKTYELIVDPVQTMLFGKFMHGIDKYVSGTGTVPRDCVDMQSLQGSGGVHADALSTVRVRHVRSTTPDTYSTLNFRSMKQSVGVFGSRALDWIWIDEGPPVDIYNECMTRVFDRQGRILLTWTPLEGFEPVVEKFIPRGKTLQEISKGGEGAVRVTDKAAVVMAGWQDIPHIPKAAQEKEIEHFRETGMPEEIIQAKVWGIPHVGEGKIYTMPREQLEFNMSDLGTIPDHWPRVFGLDVGFNVTAALWAAIDRESDRVYIYDEYYGIRQNVATNAAGIGGRDRDWIPGVVDPSSDNRSIQDGSRVMQQYIEHGLNLSKAVPAVEAGIAACQELMSTGQLKIASHLSNLWFEYHIYRREVKDGAVQSKIVKENDHLMDAMRYLVFTGIDRAKSKSQLGVIGGLMRGKVKLWKRGEG